MRLFIAINFNDETINKLLALRDELHSCSERGNFTLADNLHLTLAFLGECGPKQISAVKTAMETAKFAPFHLLIDRIGRFKRSGDVWWAGVQESEALIKLQDELAEKLIYAGFSLDKRKYSPHITLGREIVTDSLPRQIVPFGETVSKIELMKSERIRGKLTYTAIYAKQGER